jgi:hypothetical protein
MEQQRKTAWVGGILLGLLYAAATAALLGCGAAGRAGPKLTARAIEAATKCVEQNRECFFLHVVNDNLDRLTVRLNGYKVGEVEGYGKQTFAIPASRLKDGNCAVVSLTLFPSGASGISDSQCLREGGYFDLQVDVNRRVWLVPWGGR